MGAIRVNVDNVDRAESDHMMAGILAQAGGVNAWMHNRVPTPGEHLLTIADHETPYVLVGVRMLVDPGDPADVAEVAALQDRLGLAAEASTPFAVPDYDTGSLEETRRALRVLAGGMSGFTGAFGRREDVDPVHHLLGTAAGNITADRNADGSVTVRFGGPEGRPNRVPTVQGWNYLVRFYRPRRGILDGSWRFPEPRPA